MTCTTLDASAFRPNGHVLTTGETYRDLGGDYVTNRDPNARPAASSNSSNGSDTTSR